MNRKLVSFLIAGISVVMVSCSKSSSGDKALAVKKVTIWNMPAQGRRVPAPRTLNTDKDGNLLVLDNAGRLLIFSPEGKVIKQWDMPDTELGHPEGVCMLKDGRIAVADTHYNRVVIFKTDGTVDKIFGKKGIKEGEFSNPVGIVQDDNGFLYVCGYGNADRVQKFTVDGEFILSFGKGGTAASELQRASGLIWDNGLIYVADAVNNRIQVFTDKGEFKKVFSKNKAGQPLFYLPYDLCLGNDNSIYVVEYGNSCVKKITKDGELIAEYGQTGAGRNELETPWGIAIDSKSRLFIADTGNRRIIVLTLEVKN